MRQGEPYKPIGGIKGGGSSGTDKIDSVSTPSTPSTQSTQLQQAGQKFQIADTRLGQILQNMFQRAEGAMQSFRIPGTSRTVVDKREEGAAAEAEGKKGADQKGKSEGTTDASEARRQMEIKDGKAQNVRERNYENYLGDKRQTFQERQAGERGRERPLSDFEKLIVERFEKAKKLEQDSKDGKARFLDKTIEQWRDFFQKFAERNSKRVTDMSEIQEFLYRGLVKKGDAKGVMISDIILSSGKTEKFSRFSILYQKLGDLFAKLTPGDRVSKQSLSEGLLGEQLMYLALNPPTLEQQLTMDMKPKQGMFGPESTEARAAQELGLAGYDKGAPQPSNAEQRAHVKKRKGGGGFMKSLFGDSEEIIEDKGQFVPMWQYENMKKPTTFTMKRALYSAIIIGLIVVFILVIDRFLAK